MARKIETSSSIRDLPVTTVKQMLTLATSGFGLVAALAWNEVIKEAVNIHIRPYFSKNSSLISLFIYAAIVTVLAVAITLQLTRLQTKLESQQSSRSKS